MNILLVEDNIQFNTTITNFLILKNYKVTSLHNEENIISHINEIQFDLFLIDLDSENINSLNLVNHIRKKNLLTPILIITHSLELEKYKSLIQHVNTLYINKPFHLNELEVMIENILTKTNK